MKSKFLFYVPLFFATSVFGQFHKAPDSVRITDVQGIVSIKSPTASRWSIAQPGLNLHDGDRIRTGARGANAVRLVYENGNTVVLGPDSIMEIGKGTNVRLLKGEIELVPSAEKKTPFRLWPADEAVKQRSVWRASENVEGEITLSILKKTPLWLTGFKEVNTTETTGSLIAKVDGRDVPLTVGYHHVSVEIRDQIARTTIEQSFVNHTKSRTEGVFYFPLPQEASIAGFGMWINDEYVEADVVEKQRAREIYETILRERRDPALLEWTGGNLFKARVFPILPHSEKRVKIVYTQVLPLERDGSFRYRYALRSDLMRQNPVRDLKVDVQVHSALGIKSATCKSHPDLARVDLTKNAVHIQLAEQEYTPKSDFEITVTPVESESIVTLSPHRRGEDGYFLASVKVPNFPPRRGGPPTDPTGFNVASTPLNLLFLADTSGSIDPAQRKAQKQIIEAVLSQLGEKDSFSLAVCDVDCLWWKDEAQSVTGDSIEKALGFLDRRISLGWSDLEKTFTTVIKKKIEPGTQVIYLGDGIPATAKTDPIEFAKFLKNLPAGSNDSSFHAIATGSTFESVSLKAIASLGAGNGTNRQVTDSPMETARRLLDDILNPGYSEVMVSFEGGLRTARVFLANFSNVEPGSQHFILGRYLPGEKEQSGTVLVSARSGKGDIKWTIPLTIPVLSDGEGDKGGDTGNSFIPRLWARKYLDDLLEQGATKAIREEIVSLSEEYKIMTPYTSFLVLESDADRKRFKVERRFQMRDGERFFSDGREAANFELTQQQMKRAGAWRQNLRAQVLTGMSGMGRGALQMPRTFRGSRFAMIGHGGAVAASTGSISFGAGFSTINTGAMTFSGGSGRNTLLPVAGYSGAGFKEVSGRQGNMNSLMFPVTPATPSSFEVETENFDYIGSTNLHDSSSFDFDYNGIAEDKVPFLGDLEIGSRFGGTALTSSSIDGFISAAASGPTPAAKSASVFGIAGVYTDPQFNLMSRVISGSPSSLGVRVGYDSDYIYRGNRAGYGYFNPSGQSQITSIFPNLNPAIPKIEVKSDWPEAAKKLSALLKRDAVFGEGVSRMVAKTTNFNTRRNTIASVQTNRLAVRSGDGEWVSQQLDSNDFDFSLGGNWNGVIGQTRFVFDSVTSLGRKRDVKDESDDAENWRLSIQKISPDLERIHGTLIPEIIEADKEKETVWLVLKSKAGTNKMRYLIDRNRGVILRAETMAGKGDDAAWTVSWRNTEFVKFQGRHFVKIREGLTTKGKVTSKTEIQFSKDDGGLFAAAKSAMDSGIVLSELPAKLLEARRRVKKGGASKEDWMALLMIDMASQQWEDSEEKLKQFAKAAGGEQANAKSMRWLWFQFFQQSRRNELLRQRLLEDAKVIASNVDKSPALLQLARANKLLASSNNLQAGERIKIIDLLKPVFDFPDQADKWRLTDKNWRTARAQILNQWQGSNPQERTEWWLALWKDYDWDTNLFYNYSYALWNAGDHDKYFSIVKEQLNRKDLIDSERFSIANNMARNLEGVGKHKEAATASEPFLNFKNFGEYNYRYYLKRLAYSGQTKKHDETIRNWFQKVMDTNSEVLTPVDLAKARGAAQRLVQSRGYSGVVHPRWEQILSEVAIGSAKEKGKTSITGGIVDQYLFRDTDGNKRAKSEISKFFKEQAGELERLHLQAIIQFCDLNNEEWTTVRAALLKRWRGEKDEDKRRELGDFIKNQKDQFFSNDNKGYVAFLLERLDRCKDETMRQYRRSDLFNALLAYKDWDEKHQNRLFNLLIELGTEDEREKEFRLATQVNSLIRLNDQVAKIAATKIYETEEKGVEEMTLAERKDFSKQLSEGSKEAVVRGLSEQIAKRRDDKKWDRLLQWMDLELVFYQARLPDAKPKALLQTCLDWLGDTPVEWSKIKSPTEMARLSRVLETAIFLTVNHSEKLPELAGRLEGFIDKGLSDADPDKVASWRMQKWRLLVAKGQTEPLEKALRKWITDDEFNPTWRVALGYLLAETDRLKLAVAEFQKLEKDKQLSAKEAAALSNWLLALGNKKKQQKAIESARNHAAAQALNQEMQKISQRVRSKNGGPTGKIEEKDIKIITELFRRSPSPSSYIYQLRSLYRETKDSRLPGCFIVGLMGRSAQEIYPALQQYFDITRYIEEESSVDEAMKQIEKLRSEKLVQGETDERALDLIEAELKRRASEVLNQAGQHIPVAIAALKRAMNRDFEAGERQLMAQWLRKYGASSSGELQKEIFRAFSRLDENENDVFQKLEIANQWAQLEIEHGDSEKAVDRLQIALKQARNVRGGNFTQEMQSAFSSLLDAYKKQKQFANAEKSLQLARKHAVNPQTGNWLVEKAFANYSNALENGSSTSFGTGASQYKGARRWMLDELEKRNGSNQLSNLISQFSSFHQTAHRKKIPGAGPDLKLFSKDVFLNLIENNLKNEGKMVSSIAHSLKGIFGRKEALEFSVSMLEREPEWVTQEGNRGIWNHFGYTLSDWRREEKNLPKDLENRLLSEMKKVVWRKLEIRNDRNLHFCDLGSGRCWKEKLDEFCQVAEAYVEKYGGSPSAKVNAAKFFYEYPEKKRRASDLLLEVHKTGELDQVGRQLLGAYLNETKSWEVSERIHRELVSEFPDQIGNHVQLVRALYHLKKTLAMKKALAVANIVVEKKKRPEDGVSKIARIALEVKQFALAVEWYEEAIRKHEATRPNRGVGEGTVSGYYREIAKAFSSQGKTKEAVDAASAAIVAWGPKKNERTRSIDRLREVIEESKDINAFTKLLDKEAKESGLEKPIIRKQLGRVFLEKKKRPNDAVKQFRIAVESQPEDGETHRLLVQALDKTGDSNAARDQLIESIRLAPRDLELIRDLGKRFDKAENSSGTERAFTNLVEAMPNEAEGHHELAKIRHEQTRWDEAVHHWKKVAEFRKLEPTGLIGEIKTELAANRREDAERTLKKLNEKKWPGRFDGEIQKARKQVELR